jgi:hypothetical protein
MVFIVFIGCTLKIGFIALMVLQIATSTARPCVCVGADVQSRRSPALLNTCHDSRFAPHVGRSLDHV